jgi:DNA-binding beta-propeller fold protein YncE
MSPPQTNHRILSVRLLCALSILVIAIGAGNRNAGSSPTIVWPAPPEPARIAHVLSAPRPAELGARVSGFRRLSNWVTGDRKGNESFVKPFGLALDDAGNLCVTDTGSASVGWFDPKAKRWTRWSKIGKLNFVSPVAVAKQGDLILVADSALASIIAFDTKGRLRFQIKDRLARPSGLTVGGDRLFVADSQLHRVLVFDLQGRFLSQFGRRGVAGGEFNGPTHVACDDQGSLYVTDSLYCRVQVFTAAGQFQSQIGRIGDSPGHFGRPKGVAVDRFGHIYVIDALFDTLQVFARDGSLLLTLGGPGSGAGEFWLPNGIAVGRDDRIYVADAYNGRLQIFKYLARE